MLTALIEGKDADLWYLVALILFVIVCVWRLTERAVQGAVVAAGFAFLALGFLVT